MATDTLSMLISRGVIDVAMLSKHILTVITKSDLPFMRFCESIERLASYGGASAHVVQMLIAHILANIQLEKLPTGFKKCVEIYYTQLAERGQAPSDDVKNALAGLVEKSSGLKTIVNKINKL